MLGTRTKQVNSYGKRGKRVIQEKISIFDDATPTAPWQPLVSQMRKRENIIPKSHPVSPKSAARPKKKSSPISKTLAQKTVGTPIKTAVKRLTSKEPHRTPLRTPLSPLPANVIGSPGFTTSKLSKAKAKPLVSSVVELDIVVLDSDGDVVSKERRVSGGPVAHRKVSRSSPQSVISISDDSPISIAPRLKQPKRLVKRAIVVSDDEDDDDDVPVPVVAPVAREPAPAYQLPPPPAFPIVRQSRPLQPPTALDKTAAMTILAKSSSHQPAGIAYPLPDSPITRPRVLTPIRRQGRGLFRPPSPPSPSNLSDFDLSFDLDTGVPEEELSFDSFRPPEIPEYLRPLITECGQEQSGIHDFSSFIKTFHFDSIFSGTGTNSGDLAYRKIGEASYSEVFGIGDVVLKVIPIRNEEQSASAKEKSKSAVDEPFPTDAKDVLKELIVTLAMGQVCEGFVKLLKAYVVKGCYPDLLLSLWDEYFDRKGSENIRPDTFTLSQVYAIIVLPNGGPDLEAFKFPTPTKTGWKQACSIFWQVSKALARAEQLVSFEHRDLHLGQILIKSMPIPAGLPLQTVLTNQVPSKSKAKVRPRMDDPSHGVAVTLIDLGLSRMDAGDGRGGEVVHWTPFEKELFEGEGDYQFDIYRRMVAQNMGLWEAFNPITNVMWLHYLVLKLLKCKNLKPPRKVATQSSSSFSEKECYECLVDIESWLKNCLDELESRTTPAPTKAVTSLKGKKKALTPVLPSLEGLNPICAGEVVEYGSKKGWVKAVETRTI